MEMHTHRGTGPLRPLEEPAWPHVLGSLHPGFLHWEPHVAATVRDMCGHATFMWEMLAPHVPLGGSLP